MKTEPKRTFTKKDKLRRHWLYIAREGAVNPITGFPIKDNTTKEN